jgi:hypothetical protein
MKIAGNEQLPHPLTVEDGTGVSFGTVMQAVEGEPHRALTSAILNGDVEAVKAFLKKPPAGFDFNARSYRGLNSPVPLLHLAITAEHAHRIEILQLLLDDPRIDLTTVPPDNVTSLGVVRASALTEARQYHAWRRRPDTAQAVKLIEDKLSLRLRAALLKEDTKQAVALIKAGADGHAGLYGLNDQKEDTSILQYAIALGFGDVVDAILEATPEKDRDALIEKRWAGDNSALHIAAASGQAVLFEKLRRRTDGLVRRDDDASSENASGVTPAEFLAHARKRGLPLLGFAAFAGLGAMAIPVLLGALAAVSLTVIGTALYRHIHEPETALPPSPMPSPAETGGNLVDWTPTVEAPEPTEDLPVYGPPRPPIYHVPTEILLLVNDNLWGEDPYETWEAVNNFSYTHPSFYGWLRADTRAWANFERLQNAVLPARSLWDRVLPVESTHVPNPYDLANLVQTFNLVRPERRNALLDNVFNLQDDEDRGSSLFELMPLWSLLTGGQRNRVTAEAISLGEAALHVSPDDAPRRMALMAPLIVLLPWIGDLDERPADRRTPLHAHAPGSTISRILDILVEGGSFRNMEYAFAHMDQGQQEAVAYAALHRNSLPGIRAVGRGLQHMPEGLRTGIIEVLLNAFRNGRHDGLHGQYALIALGGALPYLEGVDQDEVVTGINQLPDGIAYAALNEAWSSMGSLRQPADPDHPRRRLVRQAINIPDALLQMLALERAGDATEYMTRDERSQVIEAIRAAVANARQQQGVDVNQVMEAQVRALAGQITGIRYLDPNQRTLVLDTIAGIRDEYRLADLLVLIRPVLGNLTTQEIGRLVERVSRFRDEREKARGLAALMAAEYPTSSPAPIQPRGLPEDEPDDKPHLLTSPDATESDYEDGLNTLAERIADGMDFDETTMPSLKDKFIRPLFRNLIIYALNHNGLKFEPGQPIEEKVMYQAFDRVITALRSRVWNVFGDDPDRANEAASIFNIYWDDHKGSDDADLVAREAWKEWLKSKDLSAVPDASSPDATGKDREAALKALIDRIVKSMDFDKKTMAKLTSENLEGLFRSLITYELNRSEEKLEKDYLGSETYWKVFHRVMNAVNEALPKAFADKEKAEAAEDIFSDYWRNGGADEADELVQQACEDWLEKHGR